MHKYAMLSVYDKTEIVDIAQALSTAGYSLTATEGTGKLLAQAGLPFTPASCLTNNPAILQDCLQTFSFNVAGGILFNRDNSRHKREIEKERLPRIDVVVCNLTDIKQTVREITDFNIQHVDLGGTSMLQAAAINYKDVLSVPSPKYYPEVISALQHNENNIMFRKLMAKRTFAEIARYDTELASLLD